MEKTYAEIEQYLNEREFTKFESKNVSMYIIHEVKNNLDHGLKVSLHKVTKRIALWGFGEMENYRELDYVPTSITDDKKIIWDIITHI